MPPLAEKFLSGQKTITATNTAEQLTTVSQSVTGLLIKAKKGNAENVKVGSSEVGASSYELEPLESLEFDVVDPARVYVYGKEKDVILYFGVIP